MAAPLDDLDIRQVKQLQEGYERIRTEIGKLFVGQPKVVDELLICLLCRGHALIEGVPGLGKTLLVRTLAQALSLSFKRIQFTPDLMPTDITGTDILEEDPDSGKRHFRFMRGPIFANLILADEINRTPPKTQAALLEAMQERAVTYAGETFALDPPFFVLATQNPIEQEGTYPLPEAQLDRFMFKVRIDYPTPEEEEEIILRTTTGEPGVLEPVLTQQAILDLQNIVRRVPVSPHVAQYAVRLIRASRPQLDESPAFVKELVAWGAGTRAGQFLLLAGKAMALLKERFNVAREDIAEVAPSVLRHRIVTSFTAEAENISVEAIIRKLLDTVKEK